MKARLLAIAVLTLLLANAPLPVQAQIPDEFTNLKLLDPEISKGDLVDIMRNWATGLGVRCAHCHVGPDNLQGMDFATDEKAAKRTARQMLEMSRTLNRELLDELPTVVAEDRSRSQVVSCYTCHRGEARPPRQLVRVLSSAYDEGGVAAASERYRELRAEHYGRGRYDFGKGLLQLATQLMESGHNEDAIAIVQLGLEFEPESADLHATLGHCQLGTGDVEAAETSLQRALEIDPGNGTARWGMSRLNALKARDAETGGE